MNRFNRVFQDNLIMIIVTLLVIFQNIFVNGAILVAGLIALVQVLRIILCFVTQIKEYIQYFDLIQVWSLLLAIYFGSNQSLMSMLALCNVKEFFNTKINLQSIQLKKLLILHHVGSDIILFILCSINNLKEVHLPIIAILIHWIILIKSSKYKKVKKNTDSCTQGEIHDKIVIDSAGHTNNHSRIKLQDKQSHHDSPRDNKLEILSIFPQGIGLYKVYENQIELEYHNENMLKLSTAQRSDDILQKIYTLEQQQISDIQQKNQQDQKDSMSSFNTFQQSPIPSNFIHHFFRSKKRSQTNSLQTSQKIELFRQNSVLSSLESKGVILKKYENLCEESILEQEIKLLTKQMSKLEFQNQMKFQHQLIQEHIVVYGYQKTQDGNSKRTLEVKLYNALIKDAPYILILTRDITHRDYIQSLQEYSKQKSKMLSFVSHEYRTPLYCIIEMLEYGIEEDQKYQSQTLIMEKDSKRMMRLSYPIKITKQIKIALDNAKYLLNLSDDLLDLAQIKVGKFKINKSKFNFNLLLENCAELFQVTAEKKSIKLFINYESKAPRFIYSDSSRLKQIMINLLGNAFKFTDKGSVTIKVSLIINKLDVSVIDTGIGILEEDQAKIFQAFGKGNSEEHKKMNKSGVGLGLLISNQILQNLNQDLQSGLKFKSQYQKGSVFYFQIGFQDLNEIKSLNSLEERNQDSEESITIQQQQEDIIHKVYVNNQFSIFNRQTKAILTHQILIVDDTCMNIDMMRLKLEKLGFHQVDSANNGYSAIEKCESKWKTNHDFYKLIFMDLEMPCINGIQTTKKLLELSQNFGINITIIGCSAYETNEQKTECLQAGMKDYLIKPIQINDLQRILQQYL